MVRILKALDLKMDRTVRIALCGAVKKRGSSDRRLTSGKHFADPEAMKLTAEHAKLDAYFNFDNGTGKDPAAFTCRVMTWSGRFSKHGSRRFATSARPRQQFELPKAPITSRSSHNVGLPGFQFIQDEIEYDSERIIPTWIYDRLQKVI